MNKNIKKFVSAAVAGSMLLSLAGCVDKANEQVLDAADSFASAVKSMNAKKIKGAATEDLDDEDAEAIDFICTFADWDTEDNVSLISIVKDSLDYEIDEESVEASTKKGEGSVDVTFTMLDWESVLADEDAMTSLDAAVDALEDADTVEVEVTVEFELEDDEWVVTNAYDVIFDVYQFADQIDVEFVPPLEVDYLMWYYTDNGSFRVGEDEPIYTNCNQIDLDVCFAGYDADYSNVYYVVNYNGTDVYTSQPYNRMGYYDVDHGATLNENGHLDAGTYTITFYNGDEEIASESCTVLEEIEEPVVTNDAISVVEGSDFWDIAFCTDGTFNTETTAFNAGCPGFYIACQTVAYYDTGAEFSVNVVRDGTNLGDVSYTSEEDHNDIAIFCIEWESGSTMDAGTYVLTFTGYNGEQFAVVTLEVA